MTVQFVYSWQNDCTFNQIGHSLIGFQQNLKKAVTSIENNDSGNYLAKARYPCHIAKRINYKKWTLKEQFSSDGGCIRTYNTPRRDTYVSVDISVDVHSERSKYHSGGGQFCDEVHQFDTPSNWLKSWLTPSLHLRQGMPHHLTKLLMFRDTSRVMELLYRVNNMDSWKNTRWLTQKPSFTVVFIIQNYNENPGKNLRPYTEKIIGKYKECFRIGWFITNQRFSVK